MRPCPRPWLRARCTLALALALAACGGPAEGPNGAPSSASSVAAGPAPQDAAGAPPSAGVPSSTSTPPSPSAPVAPVAPPADAPDAGAPPPPPPSAPTPPPPATPPPATGGTLQLATPQGLYVQEPLAGEPVVSGLVLVVLDRAAPPADTVVTLNGVPLVRWMVGTPPAPSDRYWTLDPAGPRPDVRPGGALVVRATSGTLSRELALPCPADLAVASTPPAGASISGAASVRLEWSADLVVNPPTVTAMAAVHPTATLWPFDPASQALLAGGRQVFVGDAQLGVDVPVPTTSPPAYLMDLRWPGPWVPDGESGAWCGLAKRWTYAR